MTVKQTLAALKKAGTALNMKVFVSHGVKEGLYGVSYAELGKMTKSIGTDHDLALGLWDTGVHDARVLATFIADPDKLTAKGLDAWAKDLDNYILTSAFAKMVVNSKLARRKFDIWKNRKSEWIAAGAWDVLSGLCELEYSNISEEDLATNTITPSKTMPDDFCLQQIDFITQEIHSQPNRVRYSMNQALISLGARNEVTHEKALQAAATIGKVTVDHGQTNCKTPDAGPYMTKTMNHRINKQKKLAKALRGRNAAN